MRSRSAPILTSISWMDQWSPGRDASATNFRCRVERPILNVVVFDVFSSHEATGPSHVLPSLETYTSHPAGVSRGDFVVSSVTASTKMRAPKSSAYQQFLGFCPLVQRVLSLPSYAFSGPSPPVDLDAVPFQLPLETALSETSPEATFFASAT